MNNTDMVGGIPLLTVMGTPRAMGDGLGMRLKPRLQVLAQYLGEQLSAHSQTPDGMDPSRLRDLLRPHVGTLGSIEPALSMELESMAHASGLSVEDLLVVHGFDDLLSYLHCYLPVGRSTFVCLSREQTEIGRPWMVLIWEMDPALAPYLALVHRIPAHGPASISLTLSGLHPIAGLSEAGIGLASNHLLVGDGAAGLFTTHLMASMLAVPSYDDALSRSRAGPRWGGRAIHVLDAHGDRFSVELSGRSDVLLADQIRSSPRVHTNHPLDSAIQRCTVNGIDVASKSRLERVAVRAVQADAVSERTILSWFGLADDDSGQERRETTSRRAATSTGVGSTETTVAMLIDPQAREIRIRRGHCAAGLAVKKL